MPRRFALAISIALSFCLTSTAQEVTPFNQQNFGVNGSPSNLAEQVDLPKIQSFGKLVSIEGKAGDPGSLREYRDTQIPETEMGAELIFDPESNSDLKLPRLSYFSHEPYFNYRSDEESISYLPGDGDQFGWLSFESSPYVGRGYKSGITTAFNLHLLSGPNVVPLPPRLYDFSLGYQRRGRFQEFMSYDLVSSIGVFSDFEDSARDGVRFPGHAVGMLHFKPEMDVVFGVDYLSRDDIKLLPVGGVSWRPRSMPDFRFDLIFPRPRIDYSINNQSKIYVAGRLGGGTWDIEFPNNANDVLTYRDLQLLLGFERRSPDGDLAAIEFGYVFDRKLEFRTLSQTSGFEDAFVLRLVTRK
ncbi:MAG TPA: hypothetical protein VM260_01570 [Pirellula sp.]|nr:hypothetical protein [Pirellula sp.]